MTPSARNGQVVSHLSHAYTVVESTAFNYYNELNESSDHMSDCPGNGKRSPSFLGYEQQTGLTDRYLCPAFCLCGMSTNSTTASMDFQQQDSGHTPYSKYENLIQSQGGPETPSANSLLMPSYACSERASTFDDVGYQHDLMDVHYPEALSDSPDSSLSPETDTSSQSYCSDAESVQPIGDGDANLTSIHPPSIPTHCYHCTMLTPSGYNSYAINWRVPEYAESQVRPANTYDTGFGTSLPGYTLETRVDIPSSSSNHNQPHDFGWQARYNGHWPSNALGLDFQYNKLILNSADSGAHNCRLCHTDLSYSSTQQVASRPPGENAAQAAKDAFLVHARLHGASYKQIRKSGNFKEVESTLRGRFRMLTKPKHERVRKPEWTQSDIAMLKEGVRREKEANIRHKQALDKRNPRATKRYSRSGAHEQVSWKRVSDYIVDNGGSYRFGNATCRKKWDELQAKEAKMLLPPSMGQKLESD